MSSYAELLAYANELAEYYQPFSTNGEGSYSLTCPVHGGKSLQMTVTDKILLFCHGCGQGNQEPLLERIKTDGWDLSKKAIDYTNAKSKKRNNHLSQNVPAHDQIPLDYHKLSLLADDGAYYPVTRCYTYRTSSGNIAFYILRADTNKLDKKGKRVKIIKPYSSFRNQLSNTDTWEFLLGITPKPLYNLDNITKEITKPVIVVEGEKAAEAAKSLLPSYVITTYPLGMGNWKGADWKPLQGREVYLWPDNEEKSIEKFIGIAGAIEPTPKIVFDVPLKDRPTNWDLADDLPDGAFPPDMLLKNAFVPQKITKLTPLEDESELFEKYNSKLRLLSISGDTRIYDRSRLNPVPGSLIPYHYFPPNKRYEFHPREIQITEKKTEKEIDYWFESEHKIISYGVVFDPSNEEELVTDSKGNLLTNKFLGWEHKPRECDEALYKCFIDHIYHIMDKYAADYLMAFLAHLIQHPKEKPGVMPILIGKTLMGKTIIGDIISAMLGDNNVWLTDGKTFNSKWTGNCSGKISIFINEFTRKHLNEDWLNTLLTDRKVSFEQKNEKIWSEDSYHRVIATTNVGDFQLSSDDRRIFPIRVSNPAIDSFNKHNPKNKLYYKPLDALKLSEEGLCGLHSYLKNYKITLDVFTPPISDFRTDKMSPINPVEQIILEICETGSLPTEKLGKVLYFTNDNNDPAYPDFILIKFMYDMATEHYGYSGTRNAFTRDMNRFIASERPFTRQKYHYPNSDKILETRDKCFDFPSLTELRRRYNEHVDPNRIWPEGEPEPSPESPL